MTDPAQRETAALAAYADGHNCAQAVLRASGADAARITSARALGGGRAPGGRCGALHAALDLLPEARRAEVESAFIALAGAAACREIRRLKKLSCAGCVGAAARLGG